MFPRSVALAAAATVVVVTLGAALAPLPHGAALAQAVSVPWPVSPWVKAHNSSSRLVAGKPADRAAVLTGVEIRLAPGWKTYWRHPGDAGGVPPAFDWEGSINLKAVRVLYPVPERLKDPNGQSIGYKMGVVFPVEIEPVDKSKPVFLKLALEYGICREICVPAEARHELTVPSEVNAAPTELVSALAAVPKAKVSGGPSIKAATATLTGAQPAITFDIAQGHAQIADLFVEVDGGTYLPMTEKLAAPAPGVQRFRVDLKGMEDNAALKGKALKLTVAAGPDSTELAWTVK